MRIHIIKYARGGAETRRCQPRVILFGVSFGNNFPPRRLSEFTVSRHVFSFRAANQIKIPRRTYTHTHTVFFFYQLCFFPVFFFFFSVAISRLTVFRSVYRYPRQQHQYPTPRVSNPFRTSYFYHVT